jgi:6-pyruvoyltetrahydropterin/6-carboxytetrahydropterin synthase
MFRLTREVRFAVNLSTRPEEQFGHKPTNSFAGYPSLNGLGLFLAIRVTLRGDLDPSSQYLMNIKEVDDFVRDDLPQAIRMIQHGTRSPARLLGLFESVLCDAWRERLDSVALVLSPFLVLSSHSSERPMLRLSQRFEFSASHRLHNPALSDDENRRCFGKCNNPHGHGHNYEVQVTLRGEPDANGLLVSVPAFERVVAETVIDRFDHKHLNTEIPEFHDLIPSVENIARVIYRLLKPKFEAERATLASVTVWETPKTWCEYSE